MMNSIRRIIFVALALSMVFAGRAQQGSNNEEDYYKLVTIPVPENILLEIGGVATLPDGRIAVCTRRGDVFIIEDPYMHNGSAPHFTLFASGLHEPLGLAYKDGVMYAAQRGELTRLMDINGDDIADIYKTVYSWPLSGHYHEYSYGPKFAPDGSMFVTTNVSFGVGEWWRGESRVPWRGWTMKINPNGNMEPWATGMRSPCGIGMIDGELFYAENQGDWMGSGGIWHLPKGSFTGNPAGLRWTDKPNSPVELSEEEFYAKIDKRQVKKDGKHVKPTNIVNEENPDFLYTAKEHFSEIQLPAVWLPHGILGISNTEILVDNTGGKFGPFAQQIFVGDQGQSKIMRVALEKVNGEYQGVAFDFRSGFQSGVLRMTFGHDGSMFVGETNRGWRSAGTKTSGLERLVWTGNVPMEMKTVRAMPDGFEIEFTKAVDKKTAEDLDSYSGRSFIYKYHPVYGSPTVNPKDLEIKRVKVSEDGMRVRLVVNNLRQYHVHEINVAGIRSADKRENVLHPSAYYTLNNIPHGPKLRASEVRSLGSSASPEIKEKTTRNEVANTTRKMLTPPTLAEIKPLLERNTCIACHQVEKSLVGPAYRDVAKRKYSNEQIVELIYSPRPEHWPEFNTPMPPMPQVRKEEALKIAAWINSLSK
jgi:cytochrome c551/c552